MSTRPTPHAAEPAHHGPPDQDRHDSSLTALIKAAWADRV